MHLERNPLIRWLRATYARLPIDAARRARVKRWLAARSGHARRLVAAAQQDAAAELEAAASRGPSRGHASLRPAERVLARPHAGGTALGHVEYREEALGVQPTVRLLAFYLPQFHPIPENDAWWGRGFTEWTHVVRALPKVEGQVQPRLPGELGFYDLRQPDVLRRQAALARQYGLTGFCFYFYWFGGQRLLETPLLNLLDDPTLDLPFCLCWANESWTRRWDGRDGDVLMRQQHDAEDDVRFIEYVSRYLRDPRYIRVDGKPVLVVYRPSLMPDARATAQRWRARCRELGVGEIHLAFTLAFDSLVPRDIGFDAAVEFPPNNVAATEITGNVPRVDPNFRGQVFDWRSLARAAPMLPDDAGVLHRGVCPAWDNEARRPGRGRAFLHASPRGYRDWLEAAMRDTLRRSPRSGSNLLFINAWNEWSEAAYLEPDARLGYACLEATRAAVRAVAASPTGAPAAAPERICVVIHAYYPEVLDEILAYLQAWTVPHRIVITTPSYHETAVRASLATRCLVAEVVVLENRGRDILPFLRVASGLLDAGETLVLKLHTKRSAHRQDGDAWRRDLLAKLADAAQAQRVFVAFREQPALGLVVPAGHLLGMRAYWGDNAANVQYLSRRMGLAEIDPAAEHFPAGSMFYARLAALRPLLDTHLDVLEFEAEAGQKDGTLVHAVERVLAVCVRAAGMNLAVSDALDAGAPAVAQAYPYARRDEV